MIRKRPGKAEKATLRKKKGIRGGGCQMCQTHRPFFKKIDGSGNRKSEM